MTFTMIDTRTAYGIATDHQAALRQAAARAHATRANELRTSEPLPPTRGPLAAIRRRLAGTASFA